MYLEFLLRRAHSRSRRVRWYWSGVSLNSLTACSNEVTTGITGPIGSGLPQFGFPRRFAMMNSVHPSLRICKRPKSLDSDDFQLVSLNLTLGASNFLSRR